LNSNLNLTCSSASNFRISLCSATPVLCLQEFDKNRYFSNWRDLSQTDNLRPAAALVLLLKFFCFPCAKSQECNYCCVDPHGTLLTPMLFHFDFSLVAFIGIILLIGIVKKKGIRMVDFAIVATRDDGLSLARSHPPCRLAPFPPDHDDHDGSDAGQRAADGARHGSEIRQPLGYAMIGCLFVSQALTLFTTPVIDLSLDRLSVWIRGLEPVRATRKRQARPSDISSR
jgi:hypothetical protein